MHQNKIAEKFKNHSSIKSIKSAS